MKKPAVFLAGVGTCALAVASCSTTASTPAAPQSTPTPDSPQSAPGSQASSAPTVDPDTALTPKNGQSGPSVQSGTEESEGFVTVIVQLEDDADEKASLDSINEAVAAAFPGGSVSVEREYRNALRGYALRAPAGSLDVIRSVSGVKAAFLDGNNRLL